MELKRQFQRGIKSFLINSIQFLILDVGLQVRLALSRIRLKFLLKNEIFFVKSAVLRALESSGWTFKTSP